MTQLSIVLAVNDATEKDLVIPLSSINNQIGIDLNQVEVLLIDNGACKLKHPEQLRLLSRLHLRYLHLEQITAWEAALQLGIDVATGVYVMFMGGDSQLNEASILQTYDQAAHQKPAPDVISGLTLTETISADLQTSYQFGRNALTICDRWFRREFLQQYHIKLRADLRPYAEEYVSRLVDQLADQDVPLEAVGLVKFATQLDPTVLGQPAAKVNAPWLKMMGALFDHLRLIDQAAYQRVFAQTIVRLYTQLEQVDPTEKPILLALIATLVGQHAAAWPAVIATVKQAKATDQAPAAPWNAASAAFDSYLTTITPQEG